jgi:class 3 adenylate cyclase
LIRRRSNDLVWVGRAANYAAKLSSLNETGFYTYITKGVYDAMNDEAKYSNGRNMWQSRTWSAVNNMSIYCSGWGWVIP